MMREKLSKIIYNNITEPPQTGDRRSQSLGWGIG